MERLPIAILGLNFGKHIVEQVTKGPGAEYCELVAVCDMDLPKAEAVAGPLGIDAYASLGELLKRDDIPVIGLFTGPNGRAGLIRQIMAAGKDVLTTKPFEHDAAEALAVLQEAQALGRVVHLNSPSPVPTADLKQVAAWRRQHDLGRVVGARMEVWGGYHEQADGRWLDDPELCPVAPIYRLGIYLINDLIRVIGKPEKVQVMHSRIRTGRPTPDNGQLAISFANGCLANVYASLCVDDGQFYSNTMVLNFERGTIYRNIGPFKYRQGMEQTIMTLVRKTGDESSAIDRVDVSEGSGGYMWRELYNAVHGHQLPNAITPDQVALGIRVIEAMARAEKSGQTEAV